MWAPSSRLAFPQGFLLGGLLPLVPWCIYRRTSKPFWKQISVPLVLHGVGDVPSRGLGSR